VSTGTELDRRPLGLEQVPAWTELLAAISAADGDTELLSEDNVREEFDEPGCDFERGSVALYDGAAMVGYTMLVARDSATDSHDMWQFGGVHPAYRRLGLGTELLTWAERAARPLHSEQFPGLPLTLSGRCLVGNDSAMALFAVGGYTQARWFHEMRCELSAARVSQPLVPGVEVANLSAKLFGEALAVRNEAFRDHWGSTELSPESWDRHVRSSAFRPDYSFLGYLDGAPTAVVVSSEYEAYQEATGKRELYVHVVGTLKASRGRGIASGLLALALARARADGFDSASLEVDADSPTGALGLYERLGFGVSATRVTQRKPLP